MLANESSICFATEKQPQDIVLQDEARSRGSRVGFVGGPWAPCVDDMNVAGVPWKKRFPSKKGLPS